MTKSTRSRHRNWSGKSHREIVEQQSEELRDLMRSPAMVPEFDLTGSGAIDHETQFLSEVDQDSGVVNDPTGGRRGIRLEDTLIGYEELALRLWDFKLAGLGTEGKNCGKLVMSDVDITEQEDDIKAVKFTPLSCRRIECPVCYYEWAMRQTFEIALRIEAMAKIRGERPFHVVFSIHPNECRGLTWSDINQKLWRRGRRRLRYVRCDDYYVQRDGDNEERINHSVGDCPNCFNLKTDQLGGIGIFHPFRIKRKWQLRFGGSDDYEVDGSARGWKKIRQCLAEGEGKLGTYVKIGYHAHNLVFTDFPERQMDKEYLIKFAGNFERLSRKRVVALVRYLVTHTGTIRETVAYRNHKCDHCGKSYRTNQSRCGHCGRMDEIIETHVVRNRIVHPIRGWGILHNFDPKEALLWHFGKERGLEIYHDLANKIAKLLYLRNKGGEIITMEWNEVEEELEYPALTAEYVTSDEQTNWVSIFKLFDLLQDSEFRGCLSLEKLEFAESIVDYVYERGIPPPIKECSRDPSTGGIYVPGSISVSVPRGEKDFERELDNSRLARPRDRDGLTGVGLLRQKIIDLLARGEGDVFKLDICLPDYDFGQILRVLDWLSERGEIIMINEYVELNVPIPSPSPRRNVQLAIGYTAGGKVKPERSEWSRRKPRAGRRQ